MAAYTSNYFNKLLAKINGRGYKLYHTYFSALLKYGLITSLLISLLLLFNDKNAMLVDFTHKLGFVLEEVIVEGCNKTPYKEIWQALDMQAGDPIFKNDLQDVQSRINSLSWVRSSFIERKLPNKIYIKIVERQPIAVWQNNKGQFLVDSTGELIESIKDAKGWYIIRGKGGFKETPELLKNLESFRNVGERFRAANWVGKRRWNILLKPHLLVKLPEQKVSESLSYLEQLHHKYKILDRNIKMIDLRFIDKILIRMENTKEEASDGTQK